MIGRYLPVIRDGFVAARQHPLWACAFGLGIMVYQAGVILLGALVASLILQFIWP